jgi:uncharacterized Zn-binding protein involved in type VI secretion
VLSREEPAMPAMIVLGDKTDHGGEVIEASGVTDTHGKRIARVGDKVICPKKGHSNAVIVTGDLTMLIDGKAGPAVLVAALKAKYAAPRS